MIDISYQVKNNHYGIKIENTSKGETWLLTSF